MAKSYFARYWSADPAKYLLGAVRRSESCRYGRREDAELRLACAQDANGAHCVGEVVESDEIPDIFLHCGKYPQGVGGHCPGCRKLLTREDAIASVTPDTPPANTDAFARVAYWGKLAENGQVLSFRDGEFRAQVRLVSVKSRQDSVGLELLPLVYTDTCDPRYMVDKLGETFEVSEALGKDAPSASWSLTP